MAFSAGKNGYFNIDNAAGTPTDITAYLHEVQMPEEAAQLETTHLGSQEKSYVAGFIGATITLNGFFDGDSAAVHDILATGVAAAGANAKRTWVFGPEGSTSGMVKYTGELVILSMECTTGASAIVGFSTQCRIDGTVSRTTF